MSLVTTLWLNVIYMSFGVNVLKSRSIRSKQRDDGTGEQAVDVLDRQSFFIRAMKVSYRVPAA